MRFFLLLGMTVVSSRVASAAPLMTNAAKRQSHSRSEVIPLCPARWVAGGATNARSGTEQRPVHEYWAARHSRSSALPGRPFLVADSLAGPIRDGMAIHSWNVIGTGSDSTRVVLRLWGDSELEVRAAAFHAAAALCDAGWGAYVDYSTSRDGKSADVVYELSDGDERAQRAAVSSLMLELGRSIQSHR